MAIFTPGPLIGAITGNIGGLNFVLARSGPVVRQRIRRTKSTDPRRAATQQGMQLVRKSWRNLTDSQRTAWRQAALSVPHTNRLTITSNLTGFALFVRYNTERLALTRDAGIPLFTDPPPSTRLIPWPLVSFNVVSGGNKTLTIIARSRAGATRITYYAARTFSTAPRRFWNSFRLVDEFLPDPFPVPNTNILTAWDDVIGDPQVGEQCWLRVRQAPPNQPLGPATVLSTFAT